MNITPLRLEDFKKLIKNLKFVEFENIEFIPKLNEDGSKLILETNNKTISISTTLVDKVFNCYQDKICIESKHKVGNAMVIKLLDEVSHE